MSLPTSFPLLTAAEMRACDELTIHALGVPSQVLMERAARAIVSCMLREKDVFPAGPVIILCGSGNNGGDGFAVARFLSDGSMGERRAVTVLYVGRCAADGAPNPEQMSSECARQYHLAVVERIRVVTPERTDEVLSEAACVVDAIFGIGLDRPVSGAAQAVIEAVTRLGVPVLAVDIPSGLSADKGTVMGRALKATVTVTMQALKPGLLLYPGADLCGKLVVADIGIDTSVAINGRPFAHLADETLLRRVLPPRTRRSHKGTYGRVVLLCGSVGMSGAAVLAARAALRSGAGLVEIVTPEENRIVLQTAVPEAIVTVYDAHASTESAYAILRRTVRTAVERADCVVAGCGLGTSIAAAVALQVVLSCLPAEGQVPLVLDADALNLLAANESLWNTELLLSPAKQVILTPHPAELARLLTGGSANGQVISDLLRDPLGTAEQLAREHGVTMVCKDAHSVVVSPTGERFICVAGNAGMAGGGSGDVLAGILGALFGQVRDRLAESLSVGEVTAAAVFLHAAAGDLAALHIGEYSMTASDIVEAISLITKEFSNSKTHLETI